MHLRTEDTDSELPDFDDSVTEEHSRKPVTFRERHALKILGVIMGLCLGTVMFAQVAC
jgi:hypothetical protein